MIMENSGKRIFLVSDAHFGAEDPTIEGPKQERLLSFFDHVRESGDRLVILGDLFDFWFEYRHLVDMSHFPVLASLWSMKNRGLQIDYYLGNHDYWTTGFLLRDIVTNIYKDPRSEIIGGKKALLAHGDGLTNEEKGYLMMKWILRLPVSYRLYRILHPDIGSWIARKSSKTSRKRIEQKREKSSSILREYARGQLEAGAFDWIIVGHAHQPERSVFGNGVYLNIGDWSEHFTYGFINGDDIRLEQWEG